MDAVHQVEKSKITFNYERLVATLEDVTPLSESISKEEEMIFKFSTVNN